MSVQTKDTTLYAAFESIVATSAVPVLDGAQCQGDLFVIPWPEKVNGVMRDASIRSAKPLTAQRTTVVSGNGGNHHDLVAAAGVRFAPSTGLTVGTLVVDEGAEALLDHPEHGAVRIGPGVYVLRRQREQRDVIAAVQD